MIFKVKSNIFNPINKSKNLKVFLLVIYENWNGELNHYYCSSRVMKVSEPRHKMFYSFILVVCILIGTTMCSPVPKPRYEKVLIVKSAINSKIENKIGNKLFLSIKTLIAQRIKVLKVWQKHFLKLWKMVRHKNHLELRKPNISIWP